MSQQTAISPTRAQDFPEWYQQVIKAADMAENSEVRGCMVIKPWGYAIWELIQKDLDQRFKDTGHTNAYFPLLIPISYLEKEAEHAEGFATECAVVTHHRLEAQKDETTGKTRMIPTGELTEPFVIRPTSETVIGAAFARWTSSYRDLPLKVAVMGCVVNGPGEAREADIGIAGGRGEGVLFSMGQILKKVPEDALFDELMQEIDRLAAARGARNT